MRIFLKDEHLLAVTPNALSAYVKSRNWTKAGEYGEYSDVYEADGLPTIVVPNTAEIGDYARVMARLLDVFAMVEEAPVEKVYPDLLYADRDVIRVRVNEGGGGTLLFEHGVELLNGSWNMVLASAGSLSDRRPVLSRGNSREARNFLRFVDLGQTEEGSYVITLLPPPLITVDEHIEVTPSQVEQPSMFEVLVGSVEPEDVEPEGAPLGRRITRHLSETLTEVRRATEGAQAVGIRAFFEAVEKGVSANLCEALVQIIGPYDEVDVSVAWAATMPMPTLRSTSQFFKKDTPVLEEAARRFREVGPRQDQRIFGKVIRLARRDDDTEGTITLRASIDGKLQSVVVELRRDHYDKAIQAHQNLAVLELRGELELVGQRWHLREPDAVEVIWDEKDDEGLQLDFFEQNPTVTRQL